jgi:hypothetical protein
VGFFFSCFFLFCFFSTEENKRPYSGKYSTVHSTFRNVTRHIDPCPERAAGSSSPHICGGDRAERQRLRPATEKMAVVRG